MVHVEQQVESNIEGSENSYTHFCYMPGKKKHAIIASKLLNFFKILDTIHMKLSCNLFIMRKVICKNFNEKTKKSQLEIHMSFTYNKSYSLHFIITCNIHK